MHVIKADGSRQERDSSKIRAHSAWACKGLNVDPFELESNMAIQFYDGMPTSEIASAMIMSASSLISEKSPDYDYVTARLVIQAIYKEVTGGGIQYPHLRSFVEKGVGFDHLDPRVIDGRFDLERLNAVIAPHRDFKFRYLGIQTLRDRYFLVEPRKANQATKCYEMPQHFFMRVAMGLALEEDDPTARAIEFYDTMSQLDYMPSTPTLFNSCTKRPQMSSCYKNTVPDDLEDIFDFGYKSSALMSKFAGGIGTDWTPVRSAGSIIHSTNGESKGVVPFLKIQDTVAVAVNQAGKRKGAIAPYLEIWHADIYEFADLRMKTGDDYIRTPSLNPAAWVPDLFMKRKIAGENWSLFCPADVPHLHDLYGEAFEKAYIEAEQAGLARKVVPAMHLWKHLLDRLTRTGYPWITFKDPCNRRNPQAHCGVVHNSNLCTEITLVNSRDEIAVCNLGSVNLAAHVVNGELDIDKLKRTIRTAVRMLDNVIDLNYYPVPETRRSNLRHRPIGLGVMGYHEAMVAQGIDWESEEHLDWADRLFERIAFCATDASADLAIERGAYPTFDGSTWSRGLLTIDHAQDQTCREFTAAEWDALRQKVKTTGMRNSNVTSIAPTATIANIVGTTECIQAINERVLIKENLSGNFVQLSPLHVYGRPDLEKTVWEIDQEWSIDANCRRQKWIDQSQSFNLFRNPEVHTGRVLDTWYTRLWLGGGKTSYYLRNMRKGEGKLFSQIGDFEFKQDNTCTPDSGDELVCEACQ